MNVSALTKSFGGLKYIAWGVPGFAIGTYVRTRHDEYKVKKFMKAAVQGALEGVTAAEEELQGSGFLLEVPDIEVVSENARARSISRFRIVGNKVEIVEERREDMRKFEEGRVKNS
ncbi:hypothetical protein N431DRAFT_483509 [Stipitochalara longipes BDJ]|nr:hypothetical protein N431DRAFT_483509 [Stipitochalara longipes BDJ]